MQILIVTQYFWPESFIINDLARCLAENGHEVTVATGKPNYPSGRILKGYKKSGIVRERYFNVIEVLRVPLRPRGRATAFSLSLNYLSFIFSGLAFLPMLLRGRTFDAVLFFGVSPLTSAIPAALIAKLKKAHYSIWVQDLWPESLSATGYVKNKMVLRFLRIVMKQLYASCDTILLQSQAFFGAVSDIAEHKKLVYFPNPAPLEEETALELTPTVTAHFKGCFTVLFAGNLGRAQSLETIIQAARLLRNRAAIKIIIAGTGTQSEALEDSIRDQKLENIVLLGHLHQSLMPLLFAQSDVLLVTLRDEPAFKTVIPSKIQSYMQAGKPLLGALDGAGADLIKASGCGIAVAAGDSDGLADSILALSSMEDSRLEQMGMAARRYFEVHFEIRNAAKRLATMLEGRIERRQK